MNIHELLDILIVATGTLVVLLTAAIFELIREREKRRREQRAITVKKSPGLKHELASFTKGGRSRITTTRDFADSFTSRE